MLHIDVLLLLTVTRLSTCKQGPMLLPQPLTSYPEVLGKRTASDSSSSSNSGSTSSSSNSKAMLDLSAAATLREGAPQSVRAKLKVGAIAPCA